MLNNQKVQQQQRQRKLIATIKFLEKLFSFLL